MRNAPTRRKSQAEFHRDLCCLEMMLYDTSLEEDNVFCFCFFLYEGRDDLNTTISGPSSARQRNAKKNDDGPTLNAGLKAL